MYSLSAFVNSLRIVVERNSSGKEIHTLAPIKVVDFKPNFAVFLRGTTSLLVPLKHFTLLLLRTGHLYIPFTALKLKYGNVLKATIAKI